MNNKDVTVLAAQSGKERKRKNMSTLALHLLKLGSHSGIKINKTRRAEKQEIHMVFFFSFWSVSEQQSELTSNIGSSHSCLTSMLSIYMLS